MFGCRLFICESSVNYIYHMRIGGSDRGSKKGAELLQHKGFGAHGRQYSIVQRRIGLYANRRNNSCIYTVKMARFYVSRGQILEVDGGHG